MTQNRSSAVDCPFCHYTGPSAIQGNYQRSFTIEPLNPVTSGHLLVIPKEHLTRRPWNPDRVGELVGLAMVEALIRELPAFNLIVSFGAAATQTIEHVHIHLVPRHEGDGLHLPWTGQGVTS